MEDITGTSGVCCSIPCLPGNFVSGSIETGARSIVFQDVSIQ